MRRGGVRAWCWRRLRAWAWRWGCWRRYSGRIVHQRIHVQNVADSGRYSVAAAQARAYNFWAFSNRSDHTLQRDDGLAGLRLLSAVHALRLASLSDTVYEASSVTAGFSCCFLIHGWGCGCRITLSGPRDLIPSLCRIALSTRDMRNQRQLLSECTTWRRRSTRCSRTCGERLRLPTRPGASRQRRHVPERTGLHPAGRRRLVQEMDDRVNAEPVARASTFCSTG